MTPRQLNQQCGLVLPYLDKVTKAAARRYGVDKDDLFEYGLTCLAQRAANWQPGKLNFLSFIWIWLNTQIWAKAKHMASRPGYETGGRLLNAVIDPVSLQEEARNVRLSWIALCRALPLRERFVFRRRFGVCGKQRQSIKELAVSLGVSTQRVSQLCQQAVCRLRRKKNDEEVRDSLEIILSTALNNANSSAYSLSKGE